MTVMDPTNQLRVIRYGVARLLGEHDGGDRALPVESVARETATAIRELDRWMSMTAGAALTGPAQWSSDRSPATTEAEIDYWKGK